VILAGIDPGLSGAVAVVELDVRTGKIRMLSVADMPIVSAIQGKTTKRHLQLPVLANLLDVPGVGPPDAVMIEEVHAMPGQGVTSMFRFGHAAGAAAGVCAGLRIPTSFVRPQVWQPAVGVSRDGKSGRLRAANLYPDHAHMFARVKDDGRADAVLIATYFAQNSNKY
jgi:crossover junction endodeoxyribonuclease RuvC